MKQITAVIKPHMLGKVEHALHLLPEFPGFTLLGAKGHGRGRGSGHAFVPTEWDMAQHDMVAIFILCADGLAHQVVDAIQQGAHTGISGDGIIAVCDAVEIVRIRSGERGDAAV